MIATFLDNVTGLDPRTGSRPGRPPTRENYSVYLEKKQKRMTQEGREDDARMRAITREREWIQQGAKARQTKSKARIKGV